MTVNFRFTNYTSYDMVVTDPNNNSISLAPGEYQLMPTNNGIFKIAYNSQNYTLSGVALQQYIHSYYYITILNSITIANPVTNSTLCFGPDSINVAACYPLSTQAPDSAWSYYISFPDKAVISNVQTDASDISLGWLEMNYNIISDTNPSVNPSVNPITNPSVANNKKKYFLLLLIIIIIVVIGAIVYIKRDAIIKFYT